MIKYAHWTPDSGTHELPIVHRGTPLTEMPTTEMPTTEVAWWEPRPEVPTVARYERGPRFPRLRSALAALGVVFGCLALSAVPSTPMDAPAVEVAP